MFWKRKRLPGHWNRREFIAGTLLAALCPLKSGAQATPEYKIKAAFLYNFLKLVEWPPSAFEASNSPIILGLVGRDPFGGELDEAVEGKLVSGRRVEIRRVNSAEAIKKCHAIFVPNSEERRFQHLLQQAGTVPLLTVGDEIAEFARRGGIINLFKEADKIRFEINVEAAKKIGLKIHSTLLNLARIIQSN